MTTPTCTYTIRHAHRGPYVSFSDGVRSRAPFVRQMRTPKRAARLAEQLAAELTDAKASDVIAAVMIARDECIDRGLIV